MEEHAFEREMLGQPKALRTMLAAYAGSDSPLRRLEALGDAVRTPEVAFLGMGSSLFASFPAVSMLSLGGLPAHALDASEYLYYRLDSPRGRFLPVLVSQSGESPEIKRVIEGFGGKIPFVAVTNDEASSLARAATVVLPMLAGEEKTTTNKTYTNSVALLILLGGTLAGIDARDLLASLSPLPSAMETVLDGWRDRATVAADFLAAPAHLDLTGRGPSLATVHQGALILRELSHVKCAPLNAGLMRHGLLPSLADGGAVIAFAPSGVSDHLTLRLASDAVAHGGRALVVTDRAVEESDRLRAWPLPRPGGTYELQVPILEILLVEMLGLLFAERKGLEPGMGILKVTPVE